MAEELEYPLTLKDVVLYLDGGSCGFIVEDAKQKESAFCFDYRTDSDTHGALMADATSPDQDSAVVVSMAPEPLKLLLANLANAALQYQAATAENDAVKLMLYYLNEYRNQQG